MLELLDGANRTEGVIVVAATNFADRIDGALLRSGRLETRIDIPLPDATALTGILEHHLGADVATVIGTRPGHRRGRKPMLASRPIACTGKVEASREGGPVRSACPMERLNKGRTGMISTTMTMNEPTAADTLRPLALLATG